MPSAPEIPSAQGRGFLEYTYTKHSHGGTGWEFATCLWSPVKNKQGHDSYAAMRLPETGDVVVHVRDRDFVGYSRVAEPFVETSQSPPSPGDWVGMSPFYRIELQDYESFPEALSGKGICETYSEEIEQELARDRPKYYAFKTGSRGVGFNQRYLSVLTPTIFDVLNKALRIPMSIHDPAKPPAGPEDYSEGKRRLREVGYFARNPQLVRDAKQKHGCTCQICGFDYRAFYGPLGDGYIEVHHLNPLSERAETEDDDLTTSLDEVIVVCANCHRMLHRKRPALTPEELQEKRSK